jgi:hypothetical protein
MPSGKPFMSEKYYILEFYVPEANLEDVLNAIFEAGAGQYRNYDRCAWTTKGTGRFRPLEGSDPHIGELNRDEFVSEIKVECMVSDENAAKVKQALLREHPYEEPAYHFIVKNII